MAERPGQKGGAERARWLAELGEALESAQRLVKQLESMRSFDPQAPSLTSQLTQALAEVDSLRRGGFWLKSRTLPPMRFEFPHDRQDFNRG